MFSKPRETTAVTPWMELVVCLFLPVYFFLELQNTKLHKDFDILPWSILITCYVLILLVMKVLLSSTFPSLTNPQLQGTRHENSTKASQAHLENVKETLLRISLKNQKKTITIIAVKIPHLWNFSISKIIHLYSKKGNFPWCFPIQRCSSETEHVVPHLPAARMPICMEYNGATASNHRGSRLPQEVTNRAGSWSHPKKRWVLESVDKDGLYHLSSESTPT